MLSRSFRNLPSARLLLLHFALVLAAHSHDHHHDGSKEMGHLGSVSFVTSCKSDVQGSFNRGVALLHSFGYSAARAQFKQIESADPECAMAYWGESMTLFHQLWSRPSAADFALGRLLTEKASTAKEQTDRERGYIEAAAAFYAADDKSFEARTDAYSGRLDRLRKQFSDDDEASIFYALSLLASPEANKNDFAKRKQAVGLLSQTFVRRPDHPGVIHYLIHACDNPEMAEQGLSAAQLYAQVAPASAHALHMPSHIFTRLGRWDDDIHSNLASKAEAERQHETADRLHAMHFLEYAYLQLGDLAKAKAIETEAMQVSQSEFPTEREGYYFFVQVQFPTLYLLETQDWKAANSLHAPKNATPDFSAIINWAKAVSAGHLNDRAAAEAAVRDYDQDLEAVRHSTYAYVAEQMTTGQDEAHAWLNFVEGKQTEAIALMSSAADKQDKVGKGEVEIPAREMLADIYLSLNRPGDALAQYQLSLKHDPNRRHSLQGVTFASQRLH